MSVAAHVEAFRRDGFVSFSSIADQDDVEALRQGYDELLAGKIAAGALDRQLGGKLRQIMQPVYLHPAFRDSQALVRGRELACELLGAGDPVLTFSMLIYKEPGQMTETPWHQDFAYFELPFTPAGRTVPHAESVQFWMPLDDVDQENGCMHFLPGDHKGPLRPHYVAGGEPMDSGRLLAIVAPDRALDLGKAVACPLKAGGATAHDLGTPHFTSGNRTTDRPRRAFIFNFASRGLDSLRQS